MKIAVPTLALAAGLVAACTTGDATPPSGPETPVPLPPAGACIADQFQQFVGQKSPQITVPAGTVIRSYRRGDPVTMDLNPSRVNFEYDRAGVLIGVNCG